MMHKPDGKIICWWSAGVTSAIACKMAIEAYGPDNVEVVYFKIDSAHEDNERFMQECEEWYGVPIKIRKSKKYKDQFEVIKKERYINGPAGAKCTMELKKAVRYAVEKEIDYRHQVFGFEFNKKEINRALRFLEQYPQASPIFPLIEKKMDKAACLHYLEQNGIRRPVMYDMGYPNNNCIGCVKGGIGYWNKIRVDFPETFNKMIEMEEDIGATCLKDKNGKIPLKDLDPDRGRDLKIIMPDCGSFCEIEFADLEHESLADIYERGDVIKEFYV